MIYLVLIISLLLPGNELSQTFEKAIYTEETIGDVRWALIRYNKVTNGAPTTSKIRKQALFRATMSFSRIHEIPASLVKLKDF